MAKKKATAGNTMQSSTFRKRAAPKGSGMRSIGALTARRRSAGVRALDAAAGVGRVKATGGAGGGKQAYPDCKDGLKILDEVASTL